MNKLLILPLLLFVGACATIKVDVDYDDTADFGHMYQYAWLDDKPPVTGNALIDSNTLLHDRIHRGIDQWFQDHGYLKSEKKEADFLVIYRLVVENRTKITVMNPYYDYPYSWRFGYHRYFYSSVAWNYYPEQRVYEYQRGTLVVDIVDPHSKKLMWRGMAYNDISPYDTKAKKQRYVDKAIQSIMSRFPPKQE